MNGFFVYRFINNCGDIIYIGRTTNLKRRIENQHFSKNGHLPDECYKETVKVEYIELNTGNEMIMYEIYLIAKYKPKFNTEFIDGGDLFFSLPELEWSTYNLPDVSLECSLTNKDVLLLLNRFQTNARIIKSRVLLSLEILKVEEFPFSDRLKFIKSIEEDLEALEELSNYKYDERIKRFKRVRNLIEQEAV